MDIEKGRGENVAQDAMANAIKSPLLDEVSLTNAKRILIEI